MKQKDFKLLKIQDEDEDEEGSFEGNFFKACISNNSIAGIPKPIKFRPKNEKKYGKPLKNRPRD